jgi:hypothetical protein
VTYDKNFFRTLQKHERTSLRLASILWSEMKKYSRTIYYLITFWTTAYEERMIYVCYQRQGLYHFVDWYISDANYSFIPYLTNTI